MPRSSATSQRTILEEPAGCDPARWLRVQGDAMLRLGAPELAEDALQEALLGAIEEPGARSDDEAPPMPSDERARIARTLERREDFPR